jgi:hypothetical protein
MSSEMRGVLMSRLVTEADVVRAKMSVQMTQDLIAEKRRKIDQLEGRIHEKVGSPSYKSFLKAYIDCRVKKVHPS